MEYGGVGGTGCVGGAGVGGTVCAGTVTVADMDGTCVGFVDDVGTDGCGTGTRDGFVELVDDAGT